MESEQQSWCTSDVLAWRSRLSASIEDAPLVSSVDSFTWCWFHKDRRSVYFLRQRSDDGETKWNASRLVNVREHRWSILRWFCDSHRDIDFNNILRLRYLEVALLSLWEAHSDWFILHWKDRMINVWVSVRMEFCCFENVPFVYIYIYIVDISLVVVVAVAVAATQTSRSIQQTKQISRIERLFVRIKLLFRRSNFLNSSSHFYKHEICAASWCGHEVYVRESVFFHLRDELHTDLHYS